jgi:hypothetical protein
MVQLKIFLPCALALLAHVAIGAPVAKKSAAEPNPEGEGDAISEGTRALNAANEEDGGYGEEVETESSTEEEAESSAAGGDSTLLATKIIQTIISVSGDEVASTLLTEALETLGGGSPSTIDEADSTAPEGKGVDDPAAEEADAALEEDPAAKGKKK